MVVQIQVRRDTAANWTSNDPTLASGEFGFETATHKLKIGDGTTAWTSLEYLPQSEATEDLVGAMVTGNTETFIAVTYQDADGTLDFAVPVLDEDNMASDSATDLATQQSIKKYVDDNAGGDVVEDTTPQLGGDLDLNSKNIDFPTTANISDCLDEDDMATDSATMLATQQSIKAYIDKQTLVGSANAGWVVATHLGNGYMETEWRYDCNALVIRNSGANDYDITFTLTGYPTNRGGLKLYIKTLKHCVADADASDYINTTNIYGMGDSTQTLLDTNTTNITTTGAHTDNFGGTPIDCSPYNYVGVFVAIVATTASDIEIGNPLFEVYYDT